MLDKRKNRFVDFIKENSAFVILVFMLVLGAVLYESFMTLYNMTNVLRQVSFTGIVAVGMMFVILTGGIDLSVGSIFAFAGVFASYLYDFPVVIMVIIVLIATTLMGTLNGIIVARWNMPPFIVTLATMMGIRGICLLLTDGGVTRNISNEAFSVLGRGRVVGFIPVPALIFILVVIISGLILKYTPYGRTLYAVGGNEDASKMMAISVKKTKASAYAISGFCAGLAGLLMASRMSSGEPVAGTGYEMNAISAVVLGGTLMSGGKGTIQGTFFGALVMGLLNNLMNMQGNITAQMQNVITGALLLVIIIIQSRMYKTENA